MRRKMVFVAFVLSVAMLCGCTTPIATTDEPLATVTPAPTATPMPPTAPPIEDSSQKLEDYFSFVTQLSGRQADESRLALDSLLSLDAPLPDEAVDAYMAFMERLCEDLDMPDVVGWTANYSDETKAKLASYLMLIHTSEGYVAVVPDVAAIGVCLYGKTSTAYEDFFALAMLEREQRILQLTNDGTLVITFKKLADYIGRRQAFCDANPDFSQTDEMRDDISMALRWFVGTTPLPNDVPYNKNELKPDVRQSYEYFIQNYKNIEDSECYKKVAEAERLWRENGYKLTDAVKDFLEAD